MGCPSGSLLLYLAQPLTIPRQVGVEAVATLTHCQLPALTPFGTQEECPPPRQQHRWGRELRQSRVR